jgi:hypothetical protein
MLLTLAPRRSVLTLLVLSVGVAATRGTLAGVRLERADRLRPTTLVLIFRVGHGERFFIGICAVLVGLDGVIVGLGRMLVGDVMIAGLVMTGCVVMLLGRLGVLLGRFEVVLGRRMLVTGHIGVSWFGREERASRSGPCRKKSIHFPRQGWRGDLQ